jgi:hypothetical protein
MVAIASISTGWCVPSLLDERHAAAMITATSIGVMLIDRESYRDGPMYQTARG